MVDKAMHILYCGDRSYVPMLGVSMTSVVWNNTDQRIVFHLLVDDIGSQDMERMQKFYALYRNVDSIVLHRIPQQSEEMQVFRGIKSDYSEAVSYRLLAAKLLGDDVQRVLYLDGDIICRQSLAGLWSMNLGTSLAAAAPDPLEAGHLNRVGGAAYFNSGVLLMNLKQWRQEGILAKVLAYYQERQGQECMFPDQDAVNTVCSGRILRLPHRYNYTVSCNFNAPGRRPEILPDTCLVHFTGPITKPWFVTCLDRRAVLWTAYRDRSFWSDLPMQGNAALSAEMKRIRRMFEDGHGEQGFAAYAQLIHQLTTQWQPAVFL